MQEFVETQRRLRLLRLNAAACLMDFRGRSVMQALRERDALSLEQLEQLAVAVQAPTHAEQSRRVLAILDQVPALSSSPVRQPRRRRRTRPRNL